MTTINEARPYELLIRFDPVTGRLKGSHLTRCQVIIADGEPILQRPLDPEPIPAADTGALWGILDHATAAALATVEVVRGQLRETETALETARSLIANKSAQIEALEASGAEPG